MQGHLATADAPTPSEAIAEIRGVSKEWNILWQDLVELYEQEKQRTHFIGSIVASSAWMRASPATTS